MLLASAKPSSFEDGAIWSLRQPDALDLARRAGPVQPILCPLAHREDGPYHFRKSEAQTLPRHPWLRPLSAHLLYLLCGKRKASSSPHLFPNPRWVKTLATNPSPSPPSPTTPPGTHSSPPAHPPDRRRPQSPGTVALFVLPGRRILPSTLARRASCLCSHAASLLGSCSHAGAVQFAGAPHRGTPAAGPSIYPPRIYLKAVDNYHC